MAEIGRWNGHVFEVSTNVIRSFQALQIKVSAETDEKKNKKQKYVKFKNSKPLEVTMTVNLNAYAGCDVKTEVEGFLEDALTGQTDYFYIGEQKLIACQLLLTDATAKEITISQSGVWLKADVSLTFKQADKYDSSTLPGTTGGGSSGGSGKKSGSKKSSVKTSGTTTTSTVKKQTILPNVTTQIQKQVTGPLYKAIQKNYLQPAKTTTQKQKTVSTVKLKIKPTVKK